MKKPPSPRATPRPATAAVQPDRSPRFNLVQLGELAGVDCPCGRARRAFADLAQSPASVHLVEIRRDARAHYHKRLTETYVVVKGRGYLELDGERIAVRPWTAVRIRPGCRHRALGRLTILNLVVPAFDPADEWFDTPNAGPGRRRRRA